METRMRGGDGLALAIKPFVPLESMLLDLAFASDKEDAHAVASSDARWRRQARAVE
jgi:hypothetical protein